MPSRSFITKKGWYLKSDSVSSDSLRKCLKSDNPNPELVTITKTIIWKHKSKTNKPRIRNKPSNKIIQKEWKWHFKNSSGYPSKSLDWVGWQSAYNSSGKSWWGTGCILEINIKNARMGKGIGEGSWSGKELDGK